MPIHLQRSRGATMIEILVAVLLMSFGMLALGVVQATSLGNGKNALHRATAVALAVEYADLMRANQVAFQANLYNVSNELTGTPPAIAGLTCVYPACTGATLAASDLDRFKTRLRALLPGGRLHVLRDGATRDADLWILWQEPVLPLSLVLGANPDQQFDQCPDGASAISPMPRCIHMRVAL